MVLLLDYQFICQFARGFNVRSVAVAYFRVCTALVMLASEPPAPISSIQMAVPVSIMIAREITMASLREWAASSPSGAQQVIDRCILESILSMVFVLIASF